MESPCRVERDVGDAFYYRSPTQAGTVQNYAVCYPTEPAEEGGSRPVSRVLSRATIHLGRASPHASSDLPESGADHTLGFLFGLAPGGVYPAVRVTTNAVRSYRTISPLPLNKCSPAEQAVYFLWHCPSTRAVQTLSGTLPYGARTFLRHAPLNTVFR